MSIFNDKTLKGVAEIAAKIMQQEATHPTTEKEKKLAAMGHPKDKITHKDVLIGRGVLKKEEKEEQIDEASYSAKAARAGKDIGKPGKMFAKIAKSAAERYGSEERGKKVAGAVLAKLRKEETEQLQEYESKGGVYRHEGKGAKGAEYGSTEWDKEEKYAKKLTKPTKPASRKLGPRQNYVRSVKESFTEMIAAYQENGLKSIVKAETIQEEPDNEQFTKEFEDQKASMEGKKKQPAVAAAATQGVKQMPEEIEVIDANEINGVTVDTIEERTLTEPETKKKEEVVKSMKKNLAGFKSRYGERGKSVLYATATRIAKEKA